MTAKALIDECMQSGVVVLLDDGKLKLRGAPAAVKVAANQLRPHKAEILEYMAIASHEAEKQTADLLARFRLDLCANDPELELISRINAIAWHLITRCAWGFDTAFKAAAQWADNNPHHTDEAAFLDVMQLFKRIAQ